MYEEHLNYVKEYFALHGDVPPNPLMAFRSKYQHTLRVLGWAKRLVRERKDVDTDILFTAVIFHDIGCSEGKEFHAERSAKIFYEYGLKMNLDLTFIERVKGLISLHSSKELLKEKDTPIELIILMEADLLDEEGALRIVWYSLDKGISGAQSYLDVYKHIIMGSNKRLINPMVTEKAQYYWNEKQKIVEEFTRQLEDDITVN
ncbi:HD domain-containing protein [Clostridium sp. YIM B02515]|uniref:HD domain-containing protein n=1 Tax=Clostridium rhizosphaerae TaxID=2803861 RepID=A0ABS1TGG7_9CLOT|nr:HD domain-containing protein [Clostridium rhizosphaerae]MBL4938488.1 HD domain-containing protein [Clostridium rhizosphaerae]